MRAWLADIVLAIHFAFASFVVLGLMLTWVGGARGWRWVRNRRFRWAHVAAIVFVACEAVVGIACPLTVLEAVLRYSQTDTGFIAHWVGRMLYYDLPGWVFTSAYVAWAMATLITWRLIPPHAPRASHEAAR